MRSTLVLLLLLGGCGGDGGASDGGAGDLATTAAPDMTLLVNGCPPLTAPQAQPGDAIGGDTWGTFAQAWFASYCTRCHSSTATNRNGAPVGYDWDQYAKVQQYAAAIRDAVGVSIFMPLDAPMPTCAERQRLVRWIDAGLPQ
jgi:hypothetical protein